MKRNSGFTLIELLTVIAIIGILAGIAFSVGSGIILRAQIKQTQATVQSLISACDQYRHVFYRYPDIDNPPTGYPGSGAITGGTNYVDSDFREYNRRLRYMVEEKRYLIQERKEGPFVTQALPKVKDPRDGNPDNNAEMYCDAWGYPLFVCPARDHSQDTPPGPTASNRPPDIFSVGPNEANNTGNSKTKTTFDINADNADDIVGWMISTQHVEGKN